MNKIKLSESQLHRVIRESVDRVLREASLYADDPYFSKDYLQDDPRDNYPDGKEGDNEYSWDEFEGKNDRRRDFEHWKMDKHDKARKANSEWNPRHLSSGKKMMHKWVKGEKDLDAIDSVNSWNQAGY